MPSQNFLKLIEKRLFAEGIDLEKHGLAAAGGYCGKIHLSVVSEKRYIHADAVLSEIAVTFKNPDAAPCAVNIKIAGIFKTCRNAAAEDSVFYFAQYLTETAVYCRFKLCHYVSRFLRKTMRG